MIISLLMLLHPLSGQGEFMENKKSFWCCNKRVTKLNPTAQKKKGKKQKMIRTTRQRRGVDKKLYGICLVRDGN